MTTERRIRLYRTLIAIGLALVVLSVLASLLTGTFIPLAFWIPVGYGVLAFIIYRVIVEVWDRSKSGNRHDP